MNGLVTSELLLTQMTFCADISMHNCSIHNFFHKTLKISQYFFWGIFFRITPFEFKKFASMTWGRTTWEEWEWREWWAWLRHAIMSFFVMRSSWRFAKEMTALGFMSIEIPGGISVSAYHSSSLNYQHHLHKGYIKHVGAGDAHKLHIIKQSTQLDVTIK